MNKPQTVYYAHFMGIYNTPQEERDIETLTNLGFIVVNPNTSSIQSVFDKAKEDCQGDYLKAFDMVFGQMVRDCNVFAFRALPDGRIPGGVAIELRVAQAEGKSIIELPCATISRSMTGEQTREYLRDIGQR